MEEKRNKIKSRRGFIALILPLIPVVFGIIGAMTLISLGLSYFLKYRGEPTLNVVSVVGDFLNGSDLLFPTGQTDLDMAACIDSFIIARSPSSYLKGHGADFVRSSKANNINPALLVAIASAETSFGTNGIGNNGGYNYFGQTEVGGGWKKFGSVAEAIDYHANTLRQNYLNKGLNTIEKIHGKYSPDNAANDPTGLNSNWVTNVTKSFNDIRNSCSSLIGDEELKTTTLGPGNSCNAGYSGTQSSAGFIQLPKESYYSGGNGNNQWGTPQTVNLIMAVAQQFYKDTNIKLTFGDISGSTGGNIGHRSHKLGKSVDITIPGKMMVDSGVTDDGVYAKEGKDSTASYDRQYVMKLAQMLVSCLSVKQIIYDDNTLVDDFNTWAHQQHINGIYGPSQKDIMIDSDGKNWGDHSNHFHIEVGILPNQTEYNDR